MRLVIFALVTFCGSVAHAAILGGGKVDDGIISLIYNPASGNLKLDAAGKKLSAVEIVSAAGYFTGTRPPQANGVFDVFNKNKFFILKPAIAAMGNENFGDAMAKNLVSAAVQADLTINVELWPRGVLVPVDLIYVPKPSSLSLSLLTIAGLLLNRSFRIS